ncbi:MAG TPA: A24 family peptidase [Gaiellaceae bacterium]|jgi:leader peptidase (prepilin peptidase)/N-methyltransferase|nr:A24 family peptidase [Gaiellaceae bacterium]
MSVGLREQLPTGVRRLVALGLALVLAVVTFIHLGSDANAALWALVQVVLVALAAIDATSHRLPNVITLPTAAAALLLRVVFERSELVEVIVAGSVTFGAFLLLSILTRGGLGMGDVKLAAMLGFLLGYKVLGALTVGVFVGGIWSAGLLLTHRAGLRSTIAYGPFLALGGMFSILFASLPRLV